MKIPPQDPPTVLIQHLLKKLRRFNVESLFLSAKGTEVYGHLL